MGHGLARHGKEGAGWARASGSHQGNASGQEIRGSKVGPFEIVQSRDLTRSRDGIAAKQNFFIFDVDQIRYLSLRVARCSDCTQCDPLPIELFIRLRPAVDGHIFAQREEFIAHVVKHEDFLFLPHLFDIVKIAALGVRHGDLYAARLSQRIALRPIAMKVGVKNPFRLGAANRLELIECPSAAEVDEQRLVISHDGVDIHGVLDPEDAWRYLHRLRSREDGE